MLLTFLTIVTRWSCSKSNFYALIGQNLTGEFTGKIYTASGNLFTDSWNWQSFVSSWDVFNCLFLLDVQNEIQLLSRFFCNSWLVCLLHFWLRNAPLVKVIGNPISDGIVFKNELTYLPLFEAQEGWKVSSDSGLTWWPSGAASRLSCRLVSLSNYCLWCFFFPISWCRAYFMRLVYFMHETMIWPTIVSNVFRHFSTANTRKTFRRIFSYDFDCKKESLSDFLASSLLRSQLNKLSQGSWNLEI